MINPSGRKVNQGERREKSAVNSGHLAPPAQRRTAKKPILNARNVMNIIVKLLLKSTIKRNIWWDLSWCVSYAMENIVPLGRIYATIQIKSMELVGGGAVWPHVMPIPSWSL